MSVKAVFKDSKTLPTLVAFNGVTNARGPSPRHSKRVSNIQFLSIISSTWPSPRFQPVLTKRTFGASSANNALLLQQILALIETSFTNLFLFLWPQRLKIVKQMLPMIICAWRQFSRDHWSSGYLRRLMIKDVASLNPWLGDLTAWTVDG